MSRPLQPRWEEVLRTGLARYAKEEEPASQVLGVRVRRLRPRCPILLLSGATPGPFYHSHPHDPHEFDQEDFSFGAQVRKNLQTTCKIASGIGDHKLPFAYSGSRRHLESAQFVQWVSNRGDGFSANRAECQEVAKRECAELGLGAYSELGLFETGRNVTDGRMLVETFAMFGLEDEGGLSLESIDTPADMWCHGDDTEDDDEDEPAAGQSVRLDIKDEFDPKYFMPYVPGYVCCGNADLVIFTITADAGGSASTPRSASRAANCYTICPC